MPEGKKMKEITTEKLKDILKKHKKWLDYDEDGERADLQYVNFRGANLVGINLRWANLEYADFRDADLRNANLTLANLLHANLIGANLVGADLSSADLRWAGLRDADLTGAKLDNSCWYGALDVNVDKELAARLAYHFCQLKCDDPEYQEAKKALTKLANQFHHVYLYGKIGGYA